jgi:hypothetical protein
MLFDTMQSFLKNVFDNIKNKKKWFRRIGFHWNLQKLFKITQQFIYSINQSINPLCITMNSVSGCNDYIMCALAIGEKMKNVTYDACGILYAKISFLNFLKVTHGTNKINTSLRLYIISF